jgi:hypothetical protein
MQVSGQRNAPVGLPQGAHFGCGTSDGEMLMLKGW